MFLSVTSSVCIVGKSIVPHCNANEIFYRTRPISGAILQTPDLYINHYKDNKIL